MAALIAACLLLGIGSQARAEKTTTLRTLEGGLEPGVTIPVAEAVSAIAVTRDESYAYLAHTNSDSLSILDLRSLELVGGLDVGDGPIALAVSPDNTLLWVVNFYENSVWVVNLLTDTIESRIDVDEGPLAIALSSDGTRAYVANCFSGSISIIDETTRSVERTLWIGDYPQAIAVSQTDDQLYVTHRQLGTVEAFDLSSGESLGTVEVGENPRHMRVVGSKLAVASVADSTVTILEGASLDVVHTITVPPGPRALSAGVGDGELYVLSRDGRSVTRCNVNTGAKASQQLGLGRYQALGVAQQSARLYVSRVDEPTMLGWNLSVEGALDPQPLVLVASVQRPAEKQSVGSSLKVAAMTSESRATPVAPRAEDPADIRPTESIALAPVAVSPMVPVEDELASDPVAEFAAPAPASAPAEMVDGQAAVPPPVPQDVAADVSPRTPATGTLLASVSEPLQQLRLRGRRPSLAAPIGSSPVVLVSNAGTRSLSVLDVRQSAVVDTIPLPDKPSTVTTAPGGEGFYVGIEGRAEVYAYKREAPNTPQVWPLNDVPSGIAVTPAGDRILVTLAKADRCQILDAGTGAVLGSVATGERPGALAVSGDGAYAYVANIRGNSISVIDIGAASVAQTWQVGDAPSAVAVSPDNGTLAVVCSIDDEIWLLNAATGKVGQTAAAGDRPQSLAFAPDGQTVYAANFLSGSVTAVSVADGTSAAIECSQHPSAVAVSPTGEYLYVANRFAGTVSVIQVESGRVVSTLEVGDGPSALTLLAERHGT